MVVLLVEHYKGPFHIGKQQMPLLFTYAFQ